jgi:hypothetical protein
MAELFDKSGKWNKCGESSQVVPFEFNQYMKCADWYPPLFEALQTIESIFEIDIRRQLGQLDHV